MFDVSKINYLAKTNTNRYTERLSNMLLFVKIYHFGYAYHMIPYDDEQEIFCFFLWRWTRKSDVDNFQFLMAAKLHSWQRVTCLVMSRAIKILLETRNILLFLMVTNKKKVSTLLICSEGKTAPGRPRRAHLLYPIHFTQMAQSQINISWPDSMECQSKYSGWVYVCQKRYCLAKIDCLIKYQKRL